MNIYRIGSCRIFRINSRFKIFRINSRFKKFNFINNPIGHTHTPCEAIQLVNFVRGQKKIPSHLLKYIFTFYGGDQYKKNIEDIYKKNQKDIDNADVYLVELCSLKLIKYKDIYFQISRFDSCSKWNIEKPSNDILNLIERSFYTYKMFHDDILKLSKLLDNKPIIFTGHINIKNQNGVYFEGRQQVNEWIKRVCDLYGYYYYDLSSDINKDLSKYIKPDLIHFKKPTYALAKQKITNIVSSINNKL